MEHFPPAASSPPLQASLAVETPSPPPHRHPHLSLGRLADKYCALKNYKGTLPPSPGTAAQISAKDFPQPSTLLAF